MMDKRFKKDRGTFWDKDKRLNMTETVNLLNEFDEKTKDLEIELSHYIVDLHNCKCKCGVLEEENKQLKDKLFEAERNYLIETADISDKPYLDDDLEQLRKEIYGNVI